MRELVQRLESKTGQNTMASRATTFVRKWLSRRLLQSVRPRVQVRNVHIRYEDLKASHVSRRTDLWEAEPSAIGVVLGALEVQAFYAYLHAQWPLRTATDPSAHVHRVYAARNRFSRC